MDENTINRVSKEFNVEKESVAKMVSFYKEIKGDIKGQYLAHLVRVLENRMCVLTKIRSSALSYAHPH